MTDERPGGDIADRDEVLELLYWMEGEGFEANTTLDGLTRFIARPEPAVRRTLEQLADRGDVGLDPSTGRYRLTPEGRQEAARRFAEEFAPLLAQGHGECNDPDCDCHTDPSGAAECHARRAHHDHRH